MSYKVDDNRSALGRKSNNKMAKNDNNIVEDEGERRRPDIQFGQELFIVGEMQLHWDACCSGRGEGAEGEGKGRYILMHLIKKRIVFLSYR